ADEGLAHALGDVGLRAERAVLLLEVGRDEEGDRELRAVLAKDAVQAVAFVHLGGRALVAGDATTAQPLIDAALAAPSAHPDVLVRAIQLALATEPPGLARASRVARLGRVLLVRSPRDPWATMTLARALAEMGELDEAVRHMARVEEIAPRTALAAE